jgi:hypothetical protein
MGREVFYKSRLDELRAPRNANASSPISNAALGVFRAYNHSVEGEVAV